MRELVFSAGLVAMILFAPFAGAAQNEASLDPQAEQRAREIGRALRCVVCQNQSIEDSDASLAEDMRILVRARVKSGDSNAEVIAYMQNRYGDFVLLKPPVKPSTYILWFAPLFFIGLGGIWYYGQIRRRSLRRAAAPLTEEEIARLKKLETLQDDPR